jgi:hypothetical protein
MQVMVDRVVMTPGSTVAIGHGVDIDTGDPVTFGGDWRPMLVLQEAVLAEGEALAEVPDWAVV